MKSPEDLQKEVRKRQKLVEGIVGFVERVTVDHGVCVTTRERSCSTYCHWVLGPLAEFYLSFQTGQHPQGGGEQSTVSLSGEKVFDVYYWAEIKECEVRAFVDGPWLAEFAKFRKNFKKLIQDRDKKKAEEIKKAADEKKQKEEQQKLEIEARRLGLK